MNEMKVLSDEHGNVYEIVDAKAREELAKIGDLSPSDVELSCDNDGNVVIEAAMVAGGGSGGAGGFTADQISMLESVFNGLDYLTDASRNAAVALIKSLRGEGGSGGGDDPIEPPVETPILDSITAVYNGEPVPVGIDVESLRPHIVVTGHYTDGSTQTMTGYNLEGSIAEGTNSITVLVDDKTTTITVVGVAESSTEPEQKLYWAGNDLTATSEYATLGIVVKASAGDKLYANWDVSKNSGAPKPIVYDHYPDGLNGKMTNLSEIDIDDDGGYTVTDDRCAAVMFGCTYAKGANAKAYMDDGRYTSRQVQTVPFS